MSLNKLLRPVRLSLCSLWLIFFCAPVLASHGPQGGRASLALDPVDTNIIYAGSNNGLFKSTDQAENWRRIDGPINFSAGEPLINSLDRDVLYTEGYLNQISGLYKSTDGGRNWRLILSNLAYYPIMHPTNPDTLYVAATVERDTGVVKSTDGGRTWKVIGLVGMRPQSIAIHPIENNTVYVGTAIDGVYKSTDGGESWARMGLAGRWVSPVFLDPVDVNTLYGQVIYPKIGNRVAKSTDGGVTWERLPTDLYGWLTVETKDTRVMYISGYRDDGHRVLEYGVYKSTDGGESWRRVAPFVGVVLIDPSDSQIVYVGWSSDGPIKSTDGGETWCICTRGFVAGAFQRVIIAATDSRRIYADLFKSLDAGESWSRLGSLQAAVTAVDPSKPDTLYGVGFGQEWGLRKSTDAGDSWMTILREPNLGPIAIDPNDGNTIYASTHCDLFTCDVRKSTDAGMNWTRIATLPDINSFTLDGQDSQIIYAGTRLGLYRSIDGGERWDVFAFAGEFAGSLTIDEKDPRTMYVSGNGLFKSEDGGVSWTRLDVFACCVVIDPRDRNILYARYMPRGVYKSTDGGKTWELRNRGLTNTTVNDLAIARDTGRLYVATGGAGVWFSDDGAETWE